MTWVLPVLHFSIFMLRVSTAESVIIGLVVIPNQSIESIEFTIHEGVTDSMSLWFS
jgi:hypothetical protein